MATLYSRAEAYGWPQTLPKPTNGTEMSSPEKGRGDVKVPSLHLDPASPKEQTEIDRPGAKPGKSRRRQWKKVALQQEKTSYGLSADGSAARGGEGFGTLSLSIVPIVEGAHSARADQTWLTPDSRRHHPLSTPATSSLDKLPLTSHLEDLEQLAGPASKSSNPQPPKPRRKRRRPRQKRDKMQDPNYVPPHLRYRKKQTTGSAAANGGTAEATAEQPNNVSTGSKNQNQHLDSHNGARPDNSPRVKQVVRPEAYISPKRQPFAPPQSTPIQASTQNKVKQDISTASTKKGTVTSTRRSPPSPPSPPSSPAENVWQSSVGMKNVKAIQKSEEQSQPKATKQDRIPLKVQFEQANAAWNANQNWDWNDQPNENGFSNGYGNTANRHVQGRFNWPSRRDTRAPRGKTQWVKTRDIKPLPPPSESDGGASLKSNSNGDPNYDLKKITDWEGKWLPAPVEWEGRKGYQDRDFYGHIGAWVDKVWKVTNIKMDITDPTFTIEANGEMAPRTWIPNTMEGDSPQTFWRTFKDRAPAPLSDIVLTEQPWWELYSSPTSTLLPKLVVPDARLDPLEENFGLSAKDFGSDQAIKRQEAMKVEKARKAAERRRKREEKSRYIISACPDEDLPDTRIKPKANIYLRPAYPVDMEHVTRIYNHYVTNTIYCPEFLARTRAQMVDRLVDMSAAGYPFIVAVSKSNAARMNSGRPYMHVIERIVGFGHADDYCHPGSMYRYTAEMEIYVDPEHLHKGIGKCLLDKMLHLMDGGFYQSRGGYDWILKKDSDYLKYGATRLTKTINLSIPHNSATDDVIDWKSKLVKSFGFRKAGHLHNMGVKKETKIDLAIFQYTTGEVINIMAPPLQPW